MTKKRHPDKLPQTRVIRRPPCCPVCGSADRLGIEGLRTYGTFQNVDCGGPAPERATIRGGYTTCLNCDQRYLVRIIEPTSSPGEL